MITSRQANETISKVYTTESMESNKKAHHLLIWQNSQEFLKYQLRKYRVIHLYDDTAQIYFEILKKYLDTFEPEKASFDFWNRRAIQKAITKAIRFSRIYRVYQESVEGKTVQKYEARPSCPVDNNKISVVENQTLPDNFTKILQLYLDKGVLTKGEARVLFYKYQFKYTNTYIATIFGVTQQSISNYSTKALDKMKMYMIKNPQMFGR